MLDSDCVTGDAVGFPQAMRRGPGSPRSRRSRRSCAATCAPSGSSAVLSFVGAGPGDPELITVKGLRQLRDADVVIHDRLIPSALLCEGHTRRSRRRELIPSTTITIATVTIRTVDAAG